MILLRIRKEILLDPKEYGFRIRVKLIIYLGIQGLAMSRSLGDNVSKEVGVTCEP